MKCRVCGTEDKDKQMCFRMTDACCENHRKIIDGEADPTDAEWVTMDANLFGELEGQWQAPEGTMDKRHPKRKRAR